MSEIPWHPLPLHYRPFKYDDWGCIRNSEMRIFCLCKYDMDEDEQSLAKHRENGTDPCEATARMIIEAVNKSLKSHA